MLKHTLCTAALVLVCTGIEPCRAQVPTATTLTFFVGARDPHLDARYFLLSPEMTLTAPDSQAGGKVRLAKSVLLADEVGATDQHQSEALSARVWAKKVFTLPAGELPDAEVLFFGSAQRIKVNGLEAPAPAKLKSTGWQVAQLPAKLLRAGDNEIVFSGGGSLLVEPGRPGRSFKSTDEGKTWSNKQLTSKGNVEGEYVVRLRLPLHASEGWAMTQVLDLWQQPGSDIATPHKLRRFLAPTPMLQGPHVPAGTNIACWVRTGDVPQPDDRSWTGWQPLERDLTVDGAAVGHRWAQWKFVLRTTRPQVTPVLPERFLLQYEVEPAGPVAQDPIVVEKAASAGLLGSVPFVYQAPSAKLELLRKHYKLDEVIAPGKTEMEQLMLLRYWVRNQWHTAWKGSRASWMPPWDALIILECKDQPECLTMCTHYAAVFTQCCQALGWNARHCILDHHCVSEVFVHQHNKWVLMDPGNSAKRSDVGLHFALSTGKAAQAAPVPLSARELHLAYRTKQTDGLTVHFTPQRLAAAIKHLCRPAPEGKEDPQRPDVIPLAELTRYPLCQIENYRRYAFPARNNFLSTLFPGELYQGLSAYFYDGYWWVGDDRDQPRISPEYSKLLDPQRPMDVDWPLCWTGIHLSRTPKSGVLRVDLATFTPNFKHFERRTPTGAWKATPAPFTWELAPGVNELAVRAVNYWGRTGEAAVARVNLR